MKVWDGTTPNRQRLSQATAPRHEDYLVIVQQIQGIQKFLNSMTGDMEVMPDLKGQIAAAQENLEKVTTLISNITPPSDLKEELTALAARVNDVDVRERLEEVSKAADVNSRSICEVQVNMDSATKMVQDKMTALENRMRNDLSSYRQQTEAKFKSLDEENARLNRLLSIKNELARLS
jgi:hypothetical protein